MVQEDKQAEALFREARRRRRLRWSLGATIALAIVVAGAIGVAYGTGSGTPTPRPVGSAARGGGARIFTVASASMEPTLMIGDKVEVTTANLSHLRRGDVVLVEIPRPSQPITKAFKRVIGLPGETISSSGPTILVNGVPIPEPYLAPGEQPGPPITAQVIPAHDYFVLGDNRSNSLDSRFFGPVPSAAIVGMAQTIVEPPLRSGPVAGS